MEKVTSTSKRKKNSTINKEDHWISNTFVWLLVILIKTNWNKVGNTNVALNIANKCLFSCDENKLNLEEYCVLNSAANVKYGNANTILTSSYNILDEISQKEGKYCCKSIAFIMDKNDLKQYI